MKTACRLLCLAFFVSLMISVSAQAGKKSVASFEAESLQGEGVRPETKYAKDASGGAYAFLSDAQKDPAGPMRSLLRCPLTLEPGQYGVSVRCLAESGGSDSFWLIAEGNSPQLVNVDASKVWTTVKVPIGFCPGQGTLLLAAREPIRIDKIEVLPMKKTPFQLPLVVPEPDGRRPLYIDPPTLRWPRFGPGPYTVQLARTSDFADPRVYSNVPNLFLRPFDPIGPGDWRFRVKAADSAGRWLPPTRFTLPESAAPWPIRPWEEQMASIPRAHPRLYLRPEEVARFRSLVQGEMKPLLEQWKRASKSAVGAKLPEFQDSKQSVSNRREKINRQTASVGATRDLAGPVPQLALLYLLTGEAEWADEAKRRALIMAALDPNGFTSEEVSDFANAEIAQALGFVYDYMPDRLSDAEKQTIRKAIVRRVGGPMAKYMDKMELSPFGAHAWQHVIRDLTAAALAVYGDAPEASAWIEWAVKMFVAMYPWYGEGDGGSAEGAGYHRGTDMLTSLMTARLVEAATGTDLTQNPWFRNNPWFILYAHPPGGPMSAFGDNNAGTAPPDGSEKLACLLEAARYQNGFAQAYADPIDGGKPTGLHSFLLLFWGPLKPPKPQPLAQLPMARLFPATGVVYCHSAFANPAENLFFEFRSSFYGSYNHAHADQNSFNLFAYGDKLIVDTGYYIGYGDEHHYGWTVKSRAHNTILVGGVEQGPRNADAFGQITRFEDKPDYTYFVGSCPDAYLDVEVDCFDRHVLWLKPDVYIIVDKLETPDPQKFQWLLHAAERMEIDEVAQTARLNTAKAEARVAWLLPKGLRFQQTDQFSAPAELWRKQKKSMSCPSQWHLTAETAEPARGQLFLTVIQPCHTGDYARLAPPALEASAELLTVRISVRGQVRTASFDGSTGQLREVK
ncbi:MAG: DUF4962 domain-containing protein [Planctomycetota bacterium]